jgi:hypothetical protein
MLNATAVAEEGTGVPLGFVTPVTWTFSVAPAESVFPEQAVALPDLVSHTRKGDSGVYAEPVVPMVP